MGTEREHPGALLMRGALLMMAGGLIAATACNPEPSDEDYASLGQVGYRDGDDGPNSGERGCMKISEINWAGSLEVIDGGTRHNRGDIFIEFRNECARPIEMTNWLLELSGSDTAAWRIPGPPAGEPAKVIDVGEHVFVAARTDRCFPTPDYVIEDLRLPFGDAMRLTLRDSDERLMEPVGSRTQPPFAGGYDLVSVRSMERIEIMFGGRGNEPQSWHYYTDAGTDFPNNLNVAEACRTRTLASPGFPNSPDYSGAFSSGSFE